MRHSAGKTIYTIIMRPPEEIEEVVLSTVEIVSEVRTPGEEGVIIAFSVEFEGLVVWFYEGVVIWFC